MPFWIHFFFGWIFYFYFTVLWTGGLNHHLRIIDLRPYIRQYIKCYVVEIPELFFNSKDLNISNRWNF